MDKGKNKTSIEEKARTMQAQISSALKNARKKAGLTQEEVARKIGTKVPGVSRIESACIKNKYFPSLSILLKYAEAVGCKLKIEIIGKNKK